jgi:hypothetical protein
LPGESITSGVDAAHLPDELFHWKNSHLSIRNIRLAEWDQGNIAGVPMDSAFTGSQPNHDCAALSVDPLTTTIFLPRYSSFALMANSLRTFIDNL